MTTIPDHLKEMGARQESIERPESPVQLKHSVGYVQDNYDRTHLTYVMSGDDLALMRAGVQRWPLPGKKKENPGA
jgi:hypothetical protein